MTRRDVRAMPSVARRTGRTLVVAVVGLLALGACSEGSPTVGPLQTGAPSSATTAPAPAVARSSAPAAAPGFTPCDGGFECATVPVPVDYGNPTGPTIPIAIVRKPARDQAGKIGVLMLNPGGPGGSGIEAAESGAVSPEVADRFDVVGFDPRGVGRSEGLRCPVGPDTPYYGDPDAGDPVDEAATNAAVDRYSASCGQRYRDLLPHLGTRNVARDMDRIREALGQPQIDYLGFSYGTSIGQAYADEFPDRIRTMVLDGVVSAGVPTLDGGQAVSFENALRQFAASCATQPTCTLKPDAIAAVDRIRGRLAGRPMPVPGKSPLSVGLFEIGLSLPLYSKDNWPALARALAEADEGDGRKMRGFAEKYFEGSNSDTYNAVNCLDNQWPTDDAQVFAAARDIERRAPHFTGNVLVDGLTCAGWPAPQQPLTPPQGLGVPPVLVLGTTNDPATPYRNSVDLVRKLPGSGLLTYRGDGHTVYGSGVPCVDDQVNRYLLTKALPAPNATC